ncbi:MAG: hypothetical protein L6Q84_28240 [Polyangiaceae bacterium]|nr:hypothetical protein [Polyangiaceae bacterium]
MARIVVGFASASNEELAEAAASVARALQGELYGVFVEELSALRLAELPFTVLIEHSGRAQALDVAHLEALLRVAAARAQSELDRAARRQRVPVSFRVTRGRLLGELTSAAGATDLILLDSAHPAPRGSGGGPVTVVGRGPSGLRALLGLGAAVSGPDSVQAIVPDTCRTEAADWAAEAGHRLLLGRLEPGPPEVLARAIERAAPRMVLLNAAEWPESELSALRRGLRAPIVLRR